MLAEQTSIHESTVSRATASKYVMLPNGQVIPFSDFFTASLSVKDIIKDMIAAETRPLTDQEIAQELRKHGYNVARRTVAKYRDQLDILPSSLRRSRIQGGLCGGDTAVYRSVKAAGGN
jgi:RNA polymerase sigma-54 factor